MVTILGTMHGILICMDGTRHGDLDTDLDILDGTTTYTRHGYIVGTHLGII